MTDPELDLAESLLARIRRSPESFRTDGALLKEAGVGARNLQTIVRDHFHTTPAALLRRERIVRAQQLLVETKYALLDVADGAGFESASSFHEHFRRFVGMTPTAYRRIGNASEFTLSLPDDFRPEYPLRVMGRDRESLSERVEGRDLVLARLLDGHPALLHLRVNKRSARIRVEAPRKPTGAMMAAAHERVSRLLALRSEPSLFERRLEKTPHILLVSGRRGARIPQTLDVFEGLLWSIAGQQVNLAFAFKLRRRVIELTGRALGGLITHPDAEAVSRLDHHDLTSRQFSRSKAEYLIGAARAVASGVLDAEGLGRGTATAARRQLLALHGVGPWSANYVMMRGCAFEDCVPFGDTGLTSSLQDLFKLQSRPSAAQTATLMEPFAPHRSLATFHLWIRKGDPA